MEIKSNNIIINDRFPSTGFNKNTIINLIINKIKQHSIPKKIDYSEIYLVIDEALTNAMEHGNNWDPGKLVNIRVTHKNDSLMISIEDEGTGFDTEHYQHSGKNNLNLRGRGIRIIKHFCNPKWNSRGNRINFKIEVE